MSASSSGGITPGITQKPSSHSCVRFCSASSGVSSGISRGVRLARELVLLRNAAPPWAPDFDGSVLLSDGWLTDSVFCQAWRH